MDARRIRLLSEEVYQFVFQMLDSEPDSDGDEAGKVANACQKMFENHLLSDDDRMRSAVLANMRNVIANFDACDEQPTDSDVHYFGKEGVRGFDYLNHDCSEDQ